MPAQNSNQLWEENLQKAYLDYWRVKNNPEYIKFWEEVKSMGGETKACAKNTFDPPLQDGETYPEWRMRTGDEGKMEAWLVTQMRKFNVWIPLPDPFKKIDWITFTEHPDPEIIESMNNAYAYARKKILPVKIEVDGADDNKEIYQMVRRYVNFKRYWSGIGPSGRHHIAKFHLYAQAWDLKVCEGKTFSQITWMTRSKPSTVKMRVYKAFKLIYGTVSRESHPSELMAEPLCSNCDKWETCLELCPAAKRELKRVEGTMREYQTPNYDEISNKIAHQKWFNEENQ